MILMQGGRTALHYASLNGHARTCAALVNLGADVHAADADGWDSLSLSLSLSLISLSSLSFSLIFLCLPLASLLALLHTMFSSAYTHTHTHKVFLGVPSCLRG
jgi:hypothetical protein